MFIKNQCAFCLVVYFILISLMVSCHKEHHSENEDSIKKIKVPEMSKEIYLPIKLWDLITGADFEHAVKQTSQFVFWPLKVKLTEATEGVLESPVIEFEFAKGGGEIDFSKFVKNEKGSFLVNFDFEGFSSGEDLQIFYVSRAKKRKLGDEIYGSGCSYFYDVKNSVLAMMKEGGIKLNVTRDRHDSEVGGHFVFSYKKEKQTFISQVTFIDSKRTDLFCEEAFK